MRLRQRKLRASLLTDAAQSLVIIESYPDDKYLPSFLLRGEWGGTVFHAQIATDVQDGNIRVVTMYIPDPAQWDVSLRVRRLRP